MAGLYLCVACKAWTNEQRPGFLKLDRTVVTTMGGLPELRLGARPGNTERRCVGQALRPDREPSTGRWGEANVEAAAVYGPGAVGVGDAGDLVLGIGSGLDGDGTRIGGIEVDQRYRNSFRC
jgi:hypothetical protein